MSFWSYKYKGQVEREKAAERLDCFITIAYIFPNALNLEDLDLMVKWD